MIYNKSCKILLEKINYNGLKIHHSNIILVVWMGRACFSCSGQARANNFWIGLSPGYRFCISSLCEPEIFVFEPTSSLKNTNESRNLLMLMSTWVTKLIFTCIKLHLKCRISVCFMFFTRWVMVRAYEKVRAKNKMSRASSSFQKVEPSRASQNTWLTSLILSRA